MIPPKTAVATAMMAAISGEWPASRAIWAPDVAKSPRPMASGHSIARWVISMWRALKKSGVITPTPMISQTQTSFSIQKKVVLPSRRSRMVPPPNAAIAAMRTTPKMSSFLRAASMIPEAAKARTPRISNATSTVHHVLHEHCSGHRANTAWVRAEVTGDERYVWVDVAEEGCPLG